MFLCCVVVVILGLGRITSVSITFSYYSNNRIHLIGFSMGGPPTTSVWTRDGFVVAGTKHGAYSIALSLSRRRSESTYVSRLTATGYLPGKYEYSVYNEATTRFVRNSFQVDGKLHDGIKILRTIQGGLRSRVKGGRDGSGGILVATHQCTF